MSPTESEQSARGINNKNVDNNQSISRIESVKDDDGQNNMGGVEDLLLSDIHQNQSVNRDAGEHEDLDQLLKTDAFSKEIMMGQTMRDLGSTIKDAKNSSIKQDPNNK